MDIKNKEIAKEVINIFMDVSKSPRYFSTNIDLFKYELIHLNVFISDSQKNCKQKICHILNNYIGTNIEIINMVLKEYCLTILGINDKEKFISSMSQLIDYRKTKNNIENIPTIRFDYNCIEGQPNPLLGTTTNNNNYFGEFKFIMFVDEKRDYLSKENISKSNQLINFLAHELGHSLDIPLDIKKSGEKNYILKRETTAWNNAEEILSDLKIIDTQIKEHRRLSFCQYLNRDESYLLIRKIMFNFFKIKHANK